MADTNRAFERGLPSAGVFVFGGNVIGIWIRSKRYEACLGVLFSGIIISVSISRVSNRGS